METDLVKKEPDRTFLDEIKETFGCKAVDIRSFSPLTLAYIGDSIYDLIIRTVVVERGNRSAQNLHKSTVRFVNAATQAAMAEVLLPLLDEEETAVFHRGRNAKSYTTAKNASVADYRKATGLEALFGYLYLQNRMERCLELAKAGLDELKMEL